MSDASTLLNTKTKPHDRVAIAAEYSATHGCKECKAPVLLNPSTLLCSVCQEEHLESFAAPLVHRVHAGRGSPSAHTGGRELVRPSKQRAKGFADDSY